MLASEQYAFRGLFSELRVGGRSLKAPKPGYLLTRTPTQMGARGPALDADGAALRAAPPRKIELPLGESRARALEGVRVLDFGWNWAGPMAGQILADMGAEVIRIETSKRQDLMRFLDYTSWFFCHNNRSKMSATFNLAKPEGSRLVRRLVRKVDIVMDNFAAGVMARNGLSYDALVKENPGIIVTSMSMAGQEGPLREMRGFASIATGYAGLELMVGYPEIGTSTGLLPFGLGDTTMAIQGAIGALVALHARARSGEGQLVDVSQIDSAASTLGEPLLIYQLEGRIAGPQGNTHSRFFPHGTFAASGKERWLTLAVRNQEEWRCLCGVIGRGAWADDASLAEAEQRRARCRGDRRGDRLVVRGTRSGRGRRGAADSTRARRADPRARGDATRTPTSGAGAWSSSTTSRASTRVASTRHPGCSPRRPRPSPARRPRSARTTTTSSVSCSELPDDEIARLKEAGVLV